MEKKRTLRDNILSGILGILCIAWVYPIFMILFNSLPADTKLIPTNEIVNKGMQAQQPKKKQATKQKNAKTQAKQSNPNRPNKK